MKYAVDIPNFGKWSDPGEVAEFARRIEEVGWDGFFVWDHVAPHGRTPAVDPWVALSAMALRTRRLRIGTMVTPLPRST